MPRHALQRSQHLLIWLGVLPAALAITSYFTSASHFESVRTTEQTDAFLRQVEDLVAAVSDSETGQRGYLLTGDERYLAPYNRSRGTVEGQLESVVRTGSQRGIDMQALESLKTLIHDKVKELDLTLDLYRAGNRPAAMAEVETDRGQRYMMELRGILARIRSQQEALLRQSLRQQQQRERLLQAVLAAGMMLGIGLAAIAYRVNLDYEHQRDEVEGHIRQVVLERTSELQEKTRQLEARTVELQRSNADLTQFAYIASHDLQEPLRTISSYVGLLARRYREQLDETAHTYIRFVVEGAARMQTLINDLLLYSRAGTQDLELERVPASRIVETTLANLAAIVNDTGAKVHCGPLPSVLADERKLTQVFQNLLSNAIKFRKAEVSPEIKVSARAGQGHWIFSLEDNGIGFEEKYTDRIFEVFQRLHGSGQYQGNGIGLAICRRIVEHHGGRLWATSQPGTGSTFLFTIPEKDESSLRDFAG